MSEATSREVEYARRAPDSETVLGTIVQMALHRGCDISTGNTKWVPAAVELINTYVEEVLHIYKMTGQKPPFKAYVSDKR